MVQINDLHQISRVEKKSLSTGQIGVFCSEPCFVSSLLHIFQYYFCSCMYESRYGWAYFTWFKYFHFPFENMHVCCVRTASCCEESVFCFARNFFDYVQSLKPYARKCDINVLFNNDHDEYVVYSGVMLMRKTYLYGYYVLSFSSF